MNFSLTIKYLLFIFRFWIVDKINFSVVSTKSDDWVDRLSHFTTVLICIIFVVITTTAQYVGEPIVCWCPAIFTDIYIRYTNNICWVSNTYYLSFSETISRDRDERWNHVVTYYQWVPLILAFMAFLFKVPNLIWQSMNDVSGIDLQTLIEMCVAIQPVDMTKSMGVIPMNIQHRNTLISSIALFVDRWFEVRRDYKENVFVRARRTCRFFFWCIGGNREGTFLTGFYLFCKVLYCSNCVGQFFLLNSFMDTNFSTHGFDVLQHLMLTGKWKESPRFPRVTLCDFKVRQLQNVQDYTVQCALPINLFNEKIFIFMWFWLVLVSVITMISLLLWIYRNLTSTSSSRFVMKHLLLADEIHTGFNRSMVDKFVNQYLRPDGVFLLRLVDKHSSAMVARDLIVDLWKISKQTAGFRKSQRRSYCNTDACSMKSSSSSDDNQRLLNMTQSYIANGEKMYKENHWLSWTYAEISNCFTIDH